MPDRLYHLTINTGHVRWSPRSEVDDTLLPIFVSLLDATRDTDQVVPIPTTDCALSTASAGRCLIATVLGPRLEGHHPPLVTFGVAARSRCARRLWRDLHSLGSTPETAAVPLPPAPWCAVWLHTSLALHSSAGSWLGDFERCLAWAWIERKETRDSHRV